MGVLSASGLAADFTRIVDVAEVVGVKDVFVVGDNVLSLLVVDVTVSSPLPSKMESSSSEAYIEYVLAELARASTSTAHPTNALETAIFVCLTNMHKKGYIISHSRKIKVGYESMR